MELREPQLLKPKYGHDPRFRIEESIVKQWQLNRFLYQLIGADWQWVDKLSWTDAQWQEWVESERLRTFVAFHEGSIMGYYELRRDDDGDQEIAIFGLAPQFIGRGLGGVLLTHALEEGLRTARARVWLHTCDRDHPAALQNYLARGMAIYKCERVKPDSSTGLAAPL